MHVQPLNSQVLLRPIDAVERTAGGLYLPETAREQPAEGVIEALPPGGQDEIAVGDRVLYKKHAGEEITLDGRKMRLVPMDDLQLNRVARSASLCIGQRHEEDRGQITVVRSDNDLGTM